MHATKKKVSEKAVHTVACARLKKKVEEEMTVKTTRSQKCLVAPCSTAMLREFSCLHMIVINYFTALEPTVADLQMRIMQYISKHVQFRIIQIIRKPCKGGYSIVRYREESLLSR